MSARKAIRYTLNITLILETLRLIRLLYSHSQLRLRQEKIETEIASGKRMETLRWYYTRLFAKTTFSATQRCIMLQQCFNYSKQCRNNVATLCWAKNRRCESSRETSPLRPEDGDRCENVALKKKEISVLVIFIKTNCYPLNLSNVGELSLSWIP